uniref:LacI family DNA-binding transcriptional regulator n=1 Tax=Faecalicatena contorta TaxID=39482 RepID=UPI00359C8ECA
MPIRAKDIAEMLNVSTATVSIVLNNKPGVSSETRSLIINKIKEMNCDYLLKNIPATAAETGTIGFVVYKRFGDIIDEAPFFSYALESINLSLQKYGYGLKFIYISKNTSSSEKERQLNESDCDGLIIYAVEMYEDDLDLFTHTELPFVLLDNSFQTRDVDCVAINNIQGTCKAIQHFYQMGHRKIGYIKSKIAITSFNERFAEYQRQLKLLGLEYNSSYVLEVGYSEQEVNHAVKNYLTGSVMPTAFFADNDLLGCYAMQAFKQHGYAVPENISIIGFDDRPICKLVEPPLTTVAVPQALFGPSAVDLLVSKIQMPRTQSLKIDIGTNLIERSSVMRLL